MITIQLQGGLGNQLFQLAFLEYVSHLTKNPLFISDLNTPLTVHHGSGYYNTIFKYWKQFYNDIKLPISRENPKMHYQDWSKINDCKLFGYFQRYEYVDLIRDEFISKLSFNEKILDKYPDVSNTFFIHVRGGDYKGNQFHHVNLTNYYKTCMELHPGEKFVIFTNDISYANQILPNIPIIHENEIDSLYLMSKCKGCICANSSFSWWGAYLNKNRPIYFPSKWFNDSSMDTTGYYFPESKAISIN